MKGEKKRLREKFRMAVFLRDKFTCQGCGLEFNLKTKDEIDAHHITDRSKMPNGGYALENGITLCNNDREFISSQNNIKGHFPSCHKKAEFFNITKGKEHVTGFHPDDLYKKINSSYELAYKKSLEL